MRQTPPAARKFYASKVEELGKNLKDLETIVQGKQGNLTVVEDSMWLVLAGSNRRMTDWEHRSTTGEDDQ